VRARAYLRQEKRAQEREEGEEGRGKKNPGGGRRRGTGVGGEREERRSEEVRAHNRERIY
jgi:hypothetical protein